MAVAGRGTSDIDYETGVDQREMCEMCEVSAAAGLCIDCEMYICQYCFDRHRRSKTSRSHVLQDVTEKVKGITPIRFDKCAEHAQHDVKLYCTNHLLTGCAECMLFAHKTCKYEYITETAKQFEESGELARVREDIQVLETTHAEYTNTIVSKTEETEMLTKSAADDIETFNESIITYVNDAKQRLLEEVKVRESANKLQIDKLEDKMQTIGSQLDSLSSAFQDEEHVHKLFLLAIDTKPKLSLIRDALSNIDCSSIITDYTLENSKLLQDMVSNSRPICRFKDNSQTQPGKDDDFDFMLKQERKKSQQTQQQLSQRENELQKLKSNMQKLEDEHASLKNVYDKTEHERKQLEMEITKLELNEVTLSCGHTSSIDKMEKNRTIRCNVCNIIFGDQPEGTMESTAKRIIGCAYYELHFTFPHGKQSKLNCNPGNSYTGITMNGYLVNDNEGSAILSLLRQAFDRKLLFTVDSSSSITPGVIKLYQNVPYEWYEDDLQEDPFEEDFSRLEEDPFEEELRTDYPGYIQQVKRQLAAVDIRN